VLHCYIVAPEMEVLPLMGWGGGGGPAGSPKQPNALNCGSSPVTAETTAGRDACASPAAIFQVGWTLQRGLFVARHGAKNPFFCFRSGLKS
jgi:hypothetical protein